MKHGRGRLMGMLGQTGAEQPASTLLTTAGWPHANSLLGILPYPCEIPNCAQDFSGKELVGASPKPGLVLFVFNRRADLGFSAWEHCLVPFPHNFCEKCPPLEG